MKNVKRIELVVDAHHVDRIVGVLLAAGVDGYTVLRNASGWGDRGDRHPDGITGAFENCLILCACDEAQAEKLGIDLKPVLKKYGGVGLVSDAKWMLH